MRFCSWLFHACQPLMSCTLQASSYGSCKIHTSYYLNSLNFSLISIWCPIGGLEHRRCSYGNGVGVFYTFVYNHYILYRKIWSYEYNGDLYLHRVMIWVVRIKYIIDCNHIPLDKTDLPSGTTHTCLYVSYIVLYIIYIHIHTQYIKTIILPYITPSVLSVIGLYGYSRRSRIFDEPWQSMYVI